MQCHYHDPKDGKPPVIIPGCAAVAHTYDIEDCTCTKWKPTYNDLEEENKRLKKLLRNKNK